MKCLRCGYCCKKLTVVIVDDPEKESAFTNIDLINRDNDNLTHFDGLGGQCKHLRGDGPGEYYCSIHDKEWYDQTPCYQYTQVGKPDSECRMGAYLLNAIKEGKYGG